EFTVFGRPSTMSERETTPLLFAEKAPLRQAVVTAAADALGVLPKAAATSAVAAASRQAAARVRKRRSVYRADMSSSQDEPLTTYETDGRVNVGRKLTLFQRLKRFSSG
ncbi:MAG TPA: hypothetical protein VK586_25895, partial [Streptosporangiaceae bacterium]|nr:hypothetical protein [Streptosporangiaceae bacterium]